MVIEKIYAFVSVDDDGNEGILTCHGPRGPMPMIGADQARMWSLKSTAMRANKMSGIHVQLLCFEKRTVLENYPGKR